MSDDKPNALGRFAWHPGDVVFDEPEEDTPEEVLRKALSAAQLEAGNYRKKHIRFAGMDVSIECEKGTTREGVGKDGHRWKTEMHADYGYVKRTEGVDGDHVDLYLKHPPNEDAPYIYVVHQLKPDTGVYDEDKCFAGYDSEEEAKEAYLSHYDSPKFFGAITVVPVSLFKERVFNKKGEPIVPDGEQRAEHKSLFNSDWSF